MKLELESARHDRWESLLKTDPTKIVNEYEYLDDLGEVLTLRDMQYKIRALEELGITNLQFKRKSNYAND